MAKNQQKQLSFSQEAGLGKTQAFQFLFSFNSSLSYSIKVQYIFQLLCQIENSTSFCNIWDLCGGAGGGLINAWGNSMDIQSIVFISLICYRLHMWALSFSFVFVFFLVCHCSIRVWITAFPGLTIITWWPFMACWLVNTTCPPETATLYTDM